MPELRRYGRIWAALAHNSLRTQLSTVMASGGYLIGKLIRISFFMAYLLAIFDHLPSLKGYTVHQMVLFFMTFNLVDVAAQFLFRGLYGVKYLIEEGDFDKILTQPAHALFRISSMGVDFLDLFTLVPVGFITFWALSKIPGEISLVAGLLYVLLVANAMLIAYACHVFIGALSVRTHEFESAIWVYRDIMTLGRFPVTIYSDLLRGLFVTVIPVGVMVTFPAQALMGMLTWKGIVYALGLSVVLHLGAQAFWRNSLRNYTSISS